MDIREFTIEKVIEIFEGYANNRSQSRGCPFLEHSNMMGCRECSQYGAPTCLGYRIICRGEFADNEQLVKTLIKENFPTDNADLLIELELNGEYYD